MGNRILKAIEKIFENDGTRYVVIFTSHLKIKGEILIPNGKCGECVENYIAMKNVEVCRLDDYCNCDDENCDCNDDICCRFDWFNINEEKIVAFSVVKE